MLLSSHILSEVEQVCDRVSIIRAGVNVESGTLTDLRHLSPDDGPGHARPPRRRCAVSGIPGVADVVVTGDRVTCTVGGDDLGRLLEVLGRPRHHGPHERAADARGAVHGPVPHDHDGDSR